MKKLRRWPLDGRPSGRGQKALSLSFTFKLYKTSDLEASGCLEEAVEVLLRTRHLATVHVHQQQLHVLEMYILEYNNGMLAWIA